MDCGQWRVCNLAVGQCPPVQPQHHYYIVENRFDKCFFIDSRMILFKNRWIRASTVLRHRPFPTSFSRTRWRPRPICIFETDGKAEWNATGVKTIVQTPSATSNNSVRGLPRHAGSRCRRFASTAGSDSGELQAPWRAYLRKACTQL